MKSFLKIFVVVFSCAALTTHASDKIMMLSIEDALQTDDAKMLLDKNIKLFWSTQSTPETVRRMGQDVSFRTANALKYSKPIACYRAFLNALLVLEEEASARGADAIINLRGSFDDDFIDSPKEFRCDAGFFSAAVGFVGVFAKLTESK